MAAYVHPLPPTRRRLQERWPGLVPGREASLAALCESQNHRCAYCGVRMTDDWPAPTAATRDHVVPRSDGGAETRDNLVAACRLCNRAKASDEAFGFFIRVQNRIAGGYWPHGRLQERALLLAMVMQSTSRRWR